MKFKMSGEIKLGAQTRKFAKEVEAETEGHAVEMLYKLLGAQNGAKRRNVKVSEIAKVA
jgi:ribosomal protein L20A (L18A)